MSELHKIRLLGPGEKICEPGFYRIPIEVHHGQPCDGPSVTSSVLRKMEIGTPADVWAFHQLNPDRYEAKETAALRMGQALHAIIEGGMEELRARFWTLPEDKPSRPTAAQIRAISEGRGTEAGLRNLQFWAAVDRDPRTVLTNAEWELVVAMGIVARQDPGVQAALGGIPEITMAWFDEASRLWCLARPDQIDFSGMLSDFKKITTQGQPMVQATVDRKITAHRYDMQMAFAAEGYQVLTGLWPEQVGLIFQNDEPPYHVILTAIEEQDLAIGMFHNRKQRMRFRECLNVGHWPGPGEHVMAYKRPKALAEKFLEEMGVAAE